MNKQRGISLIEVLITLLVTTIGLLGLAAMQLSALQATADSGQRSQATWLMQDLIERMRANTGADDSHYQQTVTCDNQPNQCAPSEANSTSVQCTAAQMAYFDLWESQCRYSSLSSKVYNSLDALQVAAGQNSILNLSLPANSKVFELEATWFYKGSATNQTTSGIQLGQEIRR
jgi:type IV pilus assembly protein PilV